MKLITKSKILDGILQKVFSKLVLKMLMRKYEDVKYVYITARYNLYMLCILHTD